MHATEWMISSNRFSRIARRLCLSTARSIDFIATYTLSVYFLCVCVRVTKVSPHQEQQNKQKRKQKLLQNVLWKCNIVVTTKGLSQRLKITKVRESERERPRERESAHMESEWLFFTLIEYGTRIVGVCTSHFACNRPQNVQQIHPRRVCVHDCNMVREEGGPLGVVQNAILLKKNGSLDYKSSCVCGNMCVFVFSFSPLVFVFPCRRKPVVHRIGTFGFLD